MATKIAAIRGRRAVIDDGGAESGAAVDIASPSAGLPRLRIMHVIDRLDLGGTEKVMMQLIDGLDSERFEHSICTLRGASPAARSWNPDVTLVDAGAGAANLQVNVLRLARRMKEFRPAIVHSRNWGAIEAVPAARLARVPVILHSEHGYQLEMQEGLPMRQRMFRHLAYRQATAVFTVTDELRRYHEGQAYCSSGSIRVLYNGVDLTRFHPSNSTGKRVRSALNIPADHLVIGFIGRLVALKDVVTLLRAMEMLATEFPKAHAVIVGSGPELESLQTYAGQSAALAGRVAFTGAVDDVAELLTAMDVFVLPSLMEGMSNTLLEALASGVPVIATRVGGNPEVVDDGMCGYLFNPGDVDDLSCKLRTLLRDNERRRQFAAAARARANEQFSLAGMLQRYRELYLGLARERGVALAKGLYVRN